MCCVRWNRKVCRMWGIHHEVVQSLLAEGTLPPVQGKRSGTQMRFASNLSPWRLQGRKLPAASQRVLVQLANHIGTDLSCPGDHSVGDRRARSIPLGGGGD